MAKDNMKPEAEIPRPNIGDTVKIGAWAWGGVRRVWNGLHGGWAARQQQHQQGGSRPPTLFLRMCASTSAHVLHAAPRPLAPGSPPLATRRSAGG